ncbi:hypothetical protein SARC_06120 [Sphaeroforma arctica JP610]|uniref:Cupin type-1 domain-containing protein n=1 Tax=Sphaeroforma arctica JP610 TaxID=667725 RepID=A0A0L0G050_9EUKA|nr:hypothetical protein SARC_06120 [Sphaeroforma arctica JP610]KNC81563.1 hypothetical protein SARC_06120 [Sphaeroforma arctica JP610]|eukprot:XP_014155465.1 hypothetical protein SARC_06120 [Sphaeroforma arctica JP610]
MPSMPADSPAVSVFERVDYHDTEYTDSGINNDVEYQKLLTVLAEFKSELAENSIDHLYRATRDDVYDRVFDSSDYNTESVEGDQDTKLQTSNKRQTPVFQTFQSRLSTFQVSDFVFDYCQLPNTGTGNGGTIQPIELAAHPALVLANMAQTKFTIEPCGINLPHIHPRATELVYMVSGAVTVGFVGENGGGAIMNNLSADMSTFFPQGLIHFQQNMECEPAVFVSSLNGVDPGTITLPEQLFALPTEALSAAFGQSEAAINLIRNVLPMSIARSDCLARRGPADIPSAEIYLHDHTGMPMSPHTHMAAMADRTLLKNGVLSDILVFVWAKEMELCTLDDGDKSTH